MTRQDLISLIIARSAGTPQELDRLRQQLLAKSMQELDKIVDEQNLEQIRAEAQRQVAAQQYPQLIEAQQQAIAKFEELQWSVILRTPINGRILVDNLANRNVLRSWINFDEQISPEWFKQVLTEHPALAQSLVWQSAKVLDPKFQKYAADAQALQDRETFSKFARANGFSEIEANFWLVKDVLGSEFDEHTLAQAVQSGQLHLAPTSPEELAEFQEEASRQRVAYLASLPPGHPERQADVEQRRQAFQRADQERQIAGREQADAAFGFPPLPEFNLVTGERIDAAYLNKLSNTNLSLFKALMRKHGAAALTRRLNGRG